MGAALTPEQKAQVRRHTFRVLALHAATHEFALDLSRHQGAIDWVKVDAYSHLAAIYTKATQGVSIRDARFKANWQGAASVGIPRGAYLFYEPEMDPVKQCDLFSSVVDMRPGDLLPCVDLERASPEQPAAIDEMRLQRVCDILELRYGAPPLIYTSKRYLDSEQILRLPSACPLWVVDYVSETAPKMPRGVKEAVLWQVGCAPGVPGISGDVDRNLLLGSIESIRL